MSRTLDAIQMQLAAMAVDHFCVGVIIDRGEATHFDDKTVADILDMSKFLKMKNAKDRANIFIRPARSWGLIVLDDLTEGMIGQLESEGLEPACIVETSPGNYQAWVRLIRNDERKEIAPGIVLAAMQILLETIPFDPAALGWRRYGRLAGFTNQKEKHRRDDGQAPFVLVHEARGIVAAQGRKLLIEAGNKLTAAKQQRMTTRARQQPQKGLEGEFERRERGILARNRHKAWASNPDLSRLDYMIGIELVLSGFDDASILQVLTQRPDFRRHEKRDYIVRTVYAVLRDTGVVSDESHKQKLCEIYDRL